MHFDFRRTFKPTPEEEEEDMKRLMDLLRELAKEKGCVTCGHLKHVIDYPGFVTGEENECTAGLECDTVLYTVKNCQKWVNGIGEYEEEE